MRLVVDALAVRPGSAAIVTENLLRGWAQAAPQDEIVVLTGGGSELRVPAGTTQLRVSTRAGVAARLWAQSVGVRRACATVRADALLCAVTTGALLGAPCRTGAVVYDLRHEARPRQFARHRRLARRLLYGWTFRRADALVCISERTRQDLVRNRPRLAAKARTALLGSDHAAYWAPGPPDGPAYVLAFGHLPNKNVDVVLRAWACCDAPATAAMTLRVCGLRGAARTAAAARAAALGITGRVELLGRLDDERFRSLFAGAAAVVFPSDFEGFGLPVVEALRLAIPVVISADPALLEVSAGHAVVCADGSARALAAAIGQALHRTPEQRERGRAHAEGLTWAETARQVRDALTGEDLRRDHGPATTSAGQR
ncbi:MAG: glycosyltransferase family 1 protein [Jatrophihabitans sp.]|nr:MAG: glycosyltransferase family 1 protein [Jatrophihabitans sp.]